MEIGGDHGKGAFTMLLIICMELHAITDPLCFDEISGKVDSSKDKAKVLRPSANCLRKGFRVCNMPHVTDNTTVQIAIHK